MRSASQHAKRPSRRMRAGAALAIPAVLAVGGLAAVGPVGAAASDSYVTLYQDSSGRTVDISTDGILAVVLQANGGTGYEWRATQEPSTDVIAPPADVGWPYVVTAPTMLGAPVSWVWYFPASAAGTTSFAAGLYPPGVDTPEETFRLDIVVRAGTSGEAALTEPDCGRIVGIDSDGVVGMTLDSNATTGYSWKVTQEPSSILVASPGSGAYVAPPAGSPPGAGGSQEFAWGAKAAGSTDLQLGYVPPGVTAPDRTCGLTVVTGAPVLPPEKGSAAEPDASDGSLDSTPPPTSTVAARDDRTAPVLGVVAFVLLALLTAITTPVLAIRRRRPR